MFEVSKSLEHLRVKEVAEDNRGPTRTLAEQKMDRNLKKLSKSIKVPKWNPTDWKIKEKLKKKINSRKWDDINLGAGWGELESGPAPRGRRETRRSSSQQTVPRTTKVFTDLQAQSRPVLLPEEGSVFLKKSKPVFFSSMGRMHASCGTLTVSRPPVSPLPQPSPEPSPLASPIPALVSSSPPDSPSCSEGSNRSRLLEARRGSGESEESESSEESENNIQLDSSDSSDSSDCVSISSTDDDASSREDNQPHKPVSDPAVVFSAKIENSEQATEILIEAEQYWHDDNSDDQEGSLNLRVRKPFTLLPVSMVLILSYCRKISSQKSPRTLFICSVI